MDKIYGLLGYAFSTIVWTALKRGDLSYELFGPCQRCSKYKISCSRVKGCDKCGDRHECKPSGHEAVSRSKMLFKNIMLGNLIHNDHVKYQLALETNVYGGKTIIGRKEVKEIKDRISKNTFYLYDVPSGDLGKLPEQLKLHIGECPIFKIEWMRNGRYMCAMSEGYGLNIFTEGEIISISKNTGIAPKLVDECGLTQYDIAYKMWVESVFSPCTNVTYTGAGYWKSDNSVCYSTVRMMSVVINYEYIITATTIGRGSVYIF